MSGRGEGMGVVREDRGGSGGSAGDDARRGGDDIFLFFRGKVEWTRRRVARTAEVRLVAAEVHEHGGAEERGDEDTSRDGGEEAVRDDLVHEEHDRGPGARVQPLRGCVESALDEREEDAVHQESHEDADQAVHEGRPEGPRLHVRFRHRAIRGEVRGGMSHARGAFGAGTARRVRIKILQQPSCLVCVGRDDE
jgi:hypothetical protein